MNQGELLNYLFGELLYYLLGELAAIASFARLLILLDLVMLLPRLRFSTAVNDSSRLLVCSVKYIIHYSL